MKSVTNWSDIPVNSIDFKGISSARYAKMNARDETVVEELTKSIIRGNVKITGSDASVNNIGNPPVPDCKEITAEVPVLILCPENSIYAQISKKRVTRGSDARYIHTATSEDSTGPGNGRTKIQKRRVYMYSCMAREKYLIVEAIVGRVKVNILAVVFVVRKPPFVNSDVSCLSGLCAQGLALYQDIKKVREAPFLSGTSASY